MIELYTLKYKITKIVHMYFNFLNNHGIHEIW